MSRLQRSPFSRVFTIEDRAGPANSPTYQSLARALAPTWAGGALTPVRVPSADQYGQFQTVDVIHGAESLPTLPVEFRYPKDISDMLRLFRKRCPIDVQIHMGDCRSPTDFNGGWGKILVLEGASITNWGTNDLGALDSAEDAVINETVPFTGLDMYEIGRLLPAQIATALIVQEVVTVVICDSRQCGECGLPSDGCQVVFAIEKSHGASPGLPAEVIYTQNGGLTVAQMTISTLAANHDPSGAACVATRLIVISNENCALHYALITDILNGVSAWAKVTTGFVAAKCPNAIWSAGPRTTWMVGDGGYIYYTTDPTSGVTVQDAGVATTQNLKDVHGIDPLNVVAVGLNNAVVVTNNGGDTWASVTGPAPGVQLNTVRMRTRLEWLVGSDAGRLYYTRNAGQTWFEKAFPGSGAGHVRDLDFSNPTVGYMSHDTIAPLGRILRTIDGGNSWYVLPEDPFPFPSNQKINAVVACQPNCNVVFGGGLASNGTNGFLVKATI